MKRKALNASNRWQLQRDVNRKPSLGRSLNKLPIRTLPNLHIQISFPMCSDLVCCCSGKSMAAVGSGAFMPWIFGTAPGYACSFMPLPAKNRVCFAGREGLTRFSALPWSRQEVKALSSPYEPFGCRCFGGVVGGARSHVLLGRLIRFRESAIAR